MTDPFSLYDARHYPTVDVGTGFEEWARTYHRTVDGQVDLDVLGQLHTVPGPQVRRVVDLGCGMGRIGQWLRQQGIPDIHGVDCSPAMLRQAAAKQVYAPLCLADLTQCPLRGHAYDLPITVLTASHVPDFRALYAEGPRLLRPGGHFVLIDYHPFFLLRGIPTHFDRDRGESIAIANSVCARRESPGRRLASSWVGAHQEDRVGLRGQRWLLGLLLALAPPRSEAALPPLSAEDRDRLLVGEVVFREGAAPRDGSAIRRARGGTAFVWVPGAPDPIWAILTMPRRYPEVFPGLRTVEVLDEGPATWLLRTEGKFGPFTFRYHTRHEVRAEARTITWRLDPTRANDVFEDTWGSWRLPPEARGTLVVYAIGSIPKGWQPLGSVFERRGIMRALTALREAVLRERGPARQAGAQP
jgi:SAM-dependent methyltransferase